MRFLKALIICPFVVLFGCEGESHNTVSMMLDNPARDRQISALEQTTLFVDINMNNGATQNIAVPPGVFPSVSVSGIIPNASNSIEIRWYEVLNGVEINLSRQTQSFMSGGNVIINAVHIFDQYDNDNDGIPNLTERLNGTCVWSMTDDCSSQQSEDVYITSSYAQQGTNVSGEPSNTEVVISFDKNNWATGEVLMDTNELCVQMRAGEVGFQTVIAYYTVPISLVPGRYFVQYDARVVGRFAPVNVNTTRGAPEFIADFDHYVQGTPEWQSYTVQFDISTTNTSFGFQGVRAASATTYCLDNILLLRQS